MPPTNPSLDPERQAQILAKLRHDRELREKGYREQALRIYPHVCARCAREFSGKRLRELTVHHRDHNYKNNPPDGSNWELLCLYCHDYEHEKHGTVDYVERPAAEDQQPGPPIFSPFAGLDALLKPKSDQPEGETK